MIVHAQHVLNYSLIRIIELFNYVIVSFWVHRNIFSCLFSSHFCIQVASIQPCYLTLW